MSFRIPRANKLVHDVSKLETLFRTDPGVLNEIDKISGKSALHEAASGGYFDSLKFIVDRAVESPPGCEEVQIDLPCKYGTPLSCAARHNHIQCACYLVIHGASPTIACDLVKYSAVRWAKENKNKTLLDILTAASHGDISKAEHFLKMRALGGLFELKEQCLLNALVPLREAVLRLFPETPAEFEVCPQGENPSIPSLGVFLPCPRVPPFGHRQESGNTAFYLPNKSTQYGLRAIMNPSERTTKEFSDEIRLLAPLNHINVLGLIAVGSVSGLPQSCAYVVAMPSYDLCKDFLESTDPHSSSISAEGVCRLFADIVRGTKYLSQSNLMLPNLTVRSIYVHESDKYGLHAVISDLRYLQPKTSKLAHFSYVSDAEINSFLAPEVLRCELKNGDHAERLSSFNLGMIAFQLMLKVVDWVIYCPVSVSRITIPLKIKSGDLSPPLNRINPEKSHPVRAFVASMLDTDYLSRPSLEQVENKFSSSPKGALFQPMFEIVQANWNPQELNTPASAPLGVSNQKTSETLSRQIEELALPKIPFHELDFAGHGSHTVLGRGKYCIAKRAYWFRNRENVCVKELLPNKPLEMLINEAKTLMETTECPHIIKLYGVCQTDQSPYLVLVLELADSTLHDYLDKVPKLNLKEAVNLISELFDGLIFLHEKGFSHKDLHAQNVLIKEGSIRLSDFNVSVNSADQESIAMQECFFNDFAQCFSLATRILSCCLEGSPEVSALMKELDQLFSHDFEKNDSQLRSEVSEKVRLLKQLAQ